MKLLHMLKSKPDETTLKLIDLVSQGREITVERLYEGLPDYGEVVRLIFDHDSNICWW